MGLDMYLTGKKYLPLFDKGEEKAIYEDGYRLKTTEFDLGYWRKHPNLHGFIVETFADGIDECQQVSLEASDMRTIIEAVANDALPTTEGFFFGVSSNDPEEKAETIAIFEAAIRWIDLDPWHSVYYQASW